MFLSSLPKTKCCLFCFSFHFQKLNQFVIVLFWIPKKNTMHFWTELVLIVVTFTKRGLKLHGLWFSHFSVYSWQQKRSYVYSHIIQLFVSNIMFCQTSLLSSSFPNVFSGKALDTARWGEGEKQVNKNIFRLGQG